MVLPRQGADHQIQPETRVDHGTRAPVLEPYPRNALPRVRPSRPQHETHGEERHAVEHGPVVVRHRLRHLPGAPPFPSQGIEGARPRIPPLAGRDSAGHLGTDQLHSQDPKNRPLHRFFAHGCFRLRLPIHSDFRLQMVYASISRQTDLADDRHQTRLLPALHMHVHSAIAARSQYGHIYRRRLEAARHQNPSKTASHQTLICLFCSAISTLAIT